MLGACAVGGALLQQPSGPPQERQISIRARQYAYDPPTLQVNVGDTIRLRLEAQDVVHGFYLEGYDIEALLVPQSPFMVVSKPSDPEAPAQKLKEISFVAERSGKYRYRCSHTCGTLHPFMQGELVVAPNWLYGAGIGTMIGILLAGCLLALWSGGEEDRGTA